MKIYLPHIHYTVFVRRFSKPPKEIQSAKAWAHHTKNGEVILYLPKRNMPGDVAHELIHVLQFICADRNMDFVREQEHMAYIMHYLMGKVYGHTY